MTGESGPESSPRHAISRILASLKLGGIPVQNNPPLTAAPDYYTSWAAACADHLLLDRSGSRRRPSRFSAGIDGRLSRFFGHLADWKSPFGTASRLRPRRLLWAAGFSDHALGRCGMACGSRCSRSGSVSAPRPAGVFGSWRFAAMPRTGRCNGLSVAGACLMFSRDPVVMGAGVSLLPGFFLAALLTGRLRPMWPTLLAYGTGAFCRHHWRLRSLCIAGSEFSSPGSPPRCFIGWALSGPRPAR